MKFRGGFLLIELLIAVLIMGIIAAVAVPKYSSSLSRYRTQVALQRLAQDVDLCRRHARFTSQNVLLTVSFAKNFYQISPMDSPLKPGVPYQVVVGDGSNSTAICPVIKNLVSSEARENQPNLTIVFDRYGVPDRSAEIGIRSGDATGIVQLSAEGVVTRS